jgi:hypothetical protein
MVVDLEPTPTSGQYELEWSDEDKVKVEEKELEMLKEIGRQIFEDDSRPVLIFDGVCNFCNAFVNKILD